MRLPDEIRAKIPQLANVPEIGEITGAESGAYTVEFGDVRLQGLAEDFIKVEAERYASVGLAGSEHPGSRSRSPSSVPCQWATRRSRPAFQQR